MFSVGGVWGILFERWRFVKNREPITFGNFSDEISLIRFSTIENGVLRGTLQGEEARFIVGDTEEVYSVFPGEFFFSVENILPLLTHIPAPEGSLFVASKSGKYFYPLDDPSAALISVKNRIFFPSEKEALSAGFVRRSK